MKTPDRSLARLAGSLPPEELRNEFLVTGLFQPGEIGLHWWETDRTIVGGICPAAGELALRAPEGLRSHYFFERREAGLLNFGGPGIVRVDGAEYRLDHLDALYVGRGVKSVSFASASASPTAKFYLLSYSAHASYPTRQVAFRDAVGESLGRRELANERTLYKLIHAGAFPTCQLVMGVTRLAPGSVWNTMPPHTHLRRSEVYLYFDLPADQMVVHLMGQPRETRHLIVRDSEVVLSPPWSIHSGVGTTNYTFAWGMGGENQEFTDMDPVPVSDLR